MKHEQHDCSPAAFWPLAALASLAGGMAEILWISLYAAVTPLDAASVAREITASLLPAFSAGVTGVWAGLLIHVLLSVTLGLAFAHALWRPFARARGLRAALAVAVPTLGAVWAVNFFLLLPHLNPKFITLMPYSVTFASKMLFALAMTVTLAWPALGSWTRKPVSIVDMAG